MHFFSSEKKRKEEQVRKKGVPEKSLRFFEERSKRICGRYSIVPQKMWARMGHGRILLWAAGRREGKSNIFHVRSVYGIYTKISAVLKMS